MDFICIFGPQAVGKMSVGERLSEALGLPLLFNHVTLDVIWPYIGWNKKTFELSDQLRLDIFEYISKDVNHKGIIFTFVWDFDSEYDWEFVQKVKSLFQKENQRLYFVELEADLDTRLSRNASENRLLKKPSKRDLEYSENELLRSLDKHRLNSYPDEIQEKNYFRLNTNGQSVEASSEIILDWLNTVRS
ncbi:MAG: AAA family ATPase [Erysipelothrix sp.]|nr:AAA family ATPase [Erysipelothrix sp.]